MTRLKGLSAEELVTHGGASIDELVEWEKLGLLRPGEDGMFDVEALERVRFLCFLRQRGIPARDLAAISEEEGDVLGRYIELLGGARGVGRDIDAAAEQAGLDASFVRRLWLAAGLADQDVAFDEDVATLQAVTGALEAGMPEDALLQVVRVFADSLERVADAQSRLFHFYVHERLKAGGLSGADLAAATGAASAPLMNLIEPAILYFHHKAWARALREDLVFHLREDTLEPGRLGEMPVAVLFVDLASFTPLTEAMGDTAAAEVLDRFSDLVREAATLCSGRVIKQIGDEFMLVFPVGRAAVTCGLDIAERTAHEPQFPAVRIGAHEGRALYREADYLGATVNVAARVAAEAERGQFLVTAAVRASAHDLESVEWKGLGARALKGMVEPVELFEVWATGERQMRAVDPVCGMDIDPAHCEHRLVWHGNDLFFCSEACLDLFRANPDRYAVA